jgi:hypothetical protein
MPRRTQACGYLSCPPTCWRPDIGSGQVGTPAAAATGPDPLKSGSPGTALRMRAVPSVNRLLRTSERRGAAHAQNRNGKTFAVHLLGELAVVGYTLPCILRFHPIAPIPLCGWFIRPWAGSLAHNSVKKRAGGELTERYDGLPGGPRRSWPQSGGPHMVSSSSTISEGPTPRLLAHQQPAQSDAYRIRAANVSRAPCKSSEIATRTRA